MPGLISFTAGLSGNRRSRTIRHVPLSEAARPDGFKRSPVTVNSVISGVRGQAQLVMSTSGNSSPEVNDVPWLEIDQPSHTSGKPGP